jgi:hypothetical protein
MSYTSDLENVIAKRLGRQPCKDDNSNFYYEIVDATKKRCCLLLTVSVTLTGCIDDIFSNICFLDTSLTWVFTKDDDEYTASVTLFDILINCCSANDGSVGLITQTEVTVNETEH